MGQWSAHWVAEALMSSPPPHATRVTRWVLRPIDEVFDAISDPETYPTWLVGCRTIRSIDDHWPASGAQFHHRVGLVGPLAVNDSCEALEVEPPTHLALEVRVRPAGRGRVDFWLSSDPAPDGNVRTKIDMDEAPIGLIAPAAPVLSPLIQTRNRTSLNSLVAYLNEHPARHGRSRA
ncbi:hypothetical protein BH20ACT3_BH20ACT3_07750 [soil metagenome]